MQKAENVTWQTTKQNIFAIGQNNTAITSKKDNEHNIVRGLQYIQNSEMN